MWVDTSGARLQRYVEDCAVCCRPWQVEASVDHDGEAFVILARLDS